MVRILWVLFFLSFQSLALPPTTFQQAKKTAETLFSTHAQTLYCQCPYINKKVNLIACGMQSACEKPRAQRIEWEHFLRWSI
jgi:endonuclease I